MIPKIKPRIEDGVLWCDQFCPQMKIEPAQPHGMFYRCMIDSIDRDIEICPHAIKRMAVEIEAWRSWADKAHAFHMSIKKKLHSYDVGPLYICTKQAPVLRELLSLYPIDDAAIDALMAEREE